MSEIYVAGVSMTKFGPQPEKGVKDLTLQAVAECLADAGAEARVVQAAFYANVCQSPVEGQVTIGGQVALAASGLRGIPVVNVENACASASTAFWLAVNHLRAGQADIALAVGTEKLTFAEPERMAQVMKCFDGGMDISDVAGTLERLSALGAGIDGPSGQGHRTSFMEIYANLARAHMKKFGTTQEQMALVASKNHGHATLNPRCHYNKPMTVEQILAGRPLSYPLTVPMCSPLSDGSAAALVCTREGLRTLGASPRVKVLSCVLLSSTDRDFFDFENHVCRRAAKQAYAEAGVAPEDIGVAELHDAASFGEIFQSELMGFCAPGEGGPFAASGATTLGGKKPLNVSGGLESKGHPIGATGLGQIHELVTQLRGEAGPRQVENVRFALQENGGGLLGVEEASTVVSILGKA